MSTWIVTHDGQAYGPFDRFEDADKFVDGRVDMGIEEVLPPEMFGDDNANSK